MYLLDLRTGRRIRLPRAHNDFFPRWSANSQRLVYYAGDLTPRIVRRDGKTLMVIDDARIPALSPDGSQIAYISGFYSVYVADIKSRRVRRLAPSTQTGPDWSADGRTVFYGGKGGIRAVRTDGGHNRLITPLGELQDYACLTASPDGRRLAFQRVKYQSSGFLPAHDDDLVIMNVDGRNRRAVPLR